MEVEWSRRYGLLATASVVTRLIPSGSRRPTDPTILLFLLMGSARRGYWARGWQQKRLPIFFSSPFLRCVEIANEVAELLDLPIQIEWGLCEWLHPDWFSARPKTLPVETLAQRFPRIDTRCPPRTQVSYPETEAELLRRSGDTMTDLIAQVSEDLLIVGHAASVWGASARLLRSREGGDSAVPYIVPCCSLIKLTHQKRRWVLELNADASHL